MNFIPIFFNRKRHLYHNVVVCAVCFLSLCLNVSAKAVRSRSWNDDGHLSRVHTVRNVILMIPDGCSLATVSAARWYQWLQNPSKPTLNIDPYVCGTVRTSSSNAPIGDSAPTTSCYVTGELSRAGFVAMYPPADAQNDVYPMDSTKAYQPLMTVLEASKLLYGKSTGLVFTCEFPHATPADCATHCYDRNNYSVIASQMVCNNVDVVIGGGATYLQKAQQQYLRNLGYEVQTDDIDALRRYSGNRLWSLFSPDVLPYDLDRNPQKTIDLEEMTQKALGILSKNKKGFFLMVEGSRVDWAAHANDPVAMLTEYLAFDRACGAALDFARKDGNTAVVILPDHGNSGFSIGCNRCSGYETLTKEQLFGVVLRYKKTSGGLARELNQHGLHDARNTMQTYTGLEPTDMWLDSLNRCTDYAQSTLPKEERKGGSVSSLLAKTMTDATCFGFTTGGHTGEEVFLAVYNPRNERPTGVVPNYEVNTYLCKLLGLDNQLPSLTDFYFAEHSRVFQGMTYFSNAETEKIHPVLTVTNGKRVLKITGNTNQVQLDGEEMQLQTVVVYVDKNQMFYLPENLSELLK